MGVPLATGGWTGQRNQRACCPTVISVVPSTVSPSTQQCVPPSIQLLYFFFRLKTNLKGQCPQPTCLKLSPHRYPSLDCTSILDVPDRYTREVKKCQLQGSLLFTSMPHSQSTVLSLYSGQSCLMSSPPFPFTSPPVLLSVEY